MYKRQVPYHSSQSPTSKFFSIDKRPNRPYSDDELLLLNQSSSDDLDRLIEEGNFTLAGRIVKHPEQRKRAIDFVKRLKKLGREAGEELGDELEKRKEEQDNN